MARLAVGGSYISKNGAFFAVNIMKPYVFKSGRFWQVRVMHKGRQLMQFSTGTEDQDRAWKMALIGTLGYDISIQQQVSKTQLRTLLSTLYKIGTTEDWKIYSIRDYMYEWLGNRPLFVAGSTMANQQIALRHFEEFMEDRMDWVIDELKPMHIRDYAYWLVNTAGLDQGAANQRLDVLHNLLQRALEDGLIESNPAKGIRAKVRRSSLTDVRVPHQAFSRRHIHAMIEKGIAPDVNPELAIISLVALDLGGRTGDMFGLIRRNFTLKESLVVYHIRKVVKLHPVILFPPTVALLREYFEHHLVDQSPEAPLAPSFYVANNDTVDDDTFRIASAAQSTYFEHFMQATGVRPPVPPRTINGRADWDHSFHSFRPTVSTALKLAGVKVEAVMARMPHKSEEISQAYNRYTVHNICKQVFSDMGLKVPRRSQKEATLTMREIFEEMEFALKRLKSLRGKLDLHDGPMKHGLRKWRAQLRPKNLQVHTRTTRKTKVEAVGDES